MLRPSIFVLAVCAAQHLAGQTSFSRSYLLARPTHIRGSALTPDGGLVLCGWSSDGADSLAMGRGFLLRTDASGNLLWVREHDGGYRQTEDWPEAFTNIAYNDIQMSPDSSFLLVGSAFESYLEAGEFLAMGIDAFGDTLWTTFPDGWPPTATYLGIAPATGGQAFVTGYSGTGINDYVHVEKLDTQTGEKSLGQQLWLYNSGAPQSLRATQVNGSITAGYTADAGLDLWVQRSDSDLNVLWRTAFGLALPGGAIGVVADEAPDGTVWAAVRCSHYSLPTKPIAMVHFTSGGAISTAATYALPGTAVPIDMRVKAGGKLLVAGTGYKDVSTDSSYAFLMQLDPGGAVDWAWRYDGQPGDSLKVVTMEVVPGSGDIYLTGTAGTGRPLIIRTDSSGMAAGCSQQALIPVVGNTTWNLGTLQATDTVGPVVYPMLFTEHFVPNDSALYSITHDQCGANAQLYRAEGTVYHDANGNGGRDPGEVGLAWYPISLSPSTALAYTNSNGFHQLTTTIADTYTITPSLPGQWWAISSDSAAYHPTFTPADTLFENLDYGFAPALDTTILEGTFNGWVSCNFSFTHSICVSNLGTTNPQGVVSYTYDPSMQLLNATPAMDSLIGQTMYWHFDSLWFGEVAGFNLEFQLIPFTWAIGDVVTTELTVYSDDGLGNLSVADHEQINRVITCSYDPNNKEVAQPAFIPVDQDWLTYTINFQNTGTDTAYTVRIEDQLSQHLQWNTLQYLGSSHDLTGLSIGPLGKAEFTFSNIQLPDSNVNEPASHGFITYRIAPLVGIPHLTPIENNAGIFFDLNAPVITNTTANRVINCSDPGWTASIYSFAADELWVAASPFNDTMSYGIQWFLDGVPVPGAIGVLFGSPTSGTYTASMTDEFGCTQVTAPYEVINVAVQEAESAQLRAFPNPFTDATTLMMTEAIDANTTIELVDVHGRAVRSLRGNGTREVQIERGDLASGVYTLRSRDMSYRFASRVIVQ